MPLFTPHRTPNTWVSATGTIRAETHSQHRLIATPMFQLSLTLYRSALAHGLLTAESRRTELNVAMQNAYEQDGLKPPLLLLR